MNITRKIIQNNYSTGRGKYKIVKIILHTYGGPGKSLYNWFNKLSTQASAHYAIFKDGGIEQYVEEKNTAWHAGTTVYPYINAQSIGIEHQDDANPNDSIRTNELYESSAQLVADICRRYNLLCNSDTIQPHRLYNPRKSCPGGLDIERVIRRANEILNPTTPPQNDNLYRVSRDNVQVGAFANRDNAFNFWYTDKNQIIRFNNQEITLEFIQMANFLENKIIDLEQQLVNQKAEWDMKEQNLKTELSTIKEQNAQAIEILLTEHKKNMETIKQTAQIEIDNKELERAKYQRLYQSLIEFDKLDMLGRIKSVLLNILEIIRNKPSDVPKSINSQ